MNSVSVIEVFISQRIVGKLALTPEGLCAFEYDSDWLRDGYSISPFFLPLKSGLQIAKRDPFAGGFGVFDDSLPDGWGSLILDRYLTEHGVNPYKLTLLDRLALIGGSGRGALEYRPDKSIVAEDDFKDFDKIARDAEIILGDKKGDVSVDDLYRYGGSSGGARPKIFTTIDDRHWLVKFKASLDPKDIGKIEYEYSQLAKRCGIVMSETQLFGGKYFAAERFDRYDGEKVHTVSVAGLVNANYRIPSLDYSILLKLTLQLTRDMSQVSQMFRLMVFNVLISNRDDHAKNFSYQYVKGVWRLSPAYDILPSVGFYGYHTTTINGQGDPSLRDVVSVAKEVGITESEARNVVSELTNLCSSTKMLKYKLM